MVTAGSRTRLAMDSGQPVDAQEPVTLLLARPPNPQAQLLDGWRKVYASVRSSMRGRLAIGGKSMGGLETPTLIVQGERDALGDRETVEGYVLSDAIRVHWLPTANHDLKPLKIAGVSHDQCLTESAQEIARFLRA